MASKAEELNKTRKILEKTLIKLMTQTGSSLTRNRAWEALIKNANIDTLEEVQNILVRGMTERS